METPVGFSNEHIGKLVKTQTWERSAPGADSLLPDTLRVTVGVLKFVQYDKDYVRIMFEGLTQLLTVNRSTAYVEFYDGRLSRTYPTS